jgi:hypothetical protein
VQENVRDILRALGEVSRRMSALLPCPMHATDADGAAPVAWMSEEEDEESAGLLLEQAKLDSGTAMPSGTTGSPSPHLMRRGAEATLRIQLTAA